MFKQFLPEILENIKLNMPVLASSQVVPGCAFIAIQGTTVDGRVFIEEACKKGASIILYKKEEIWTDPIDLLKSQYKEVQFIALNEDPSLYLPALAHKTYPQLPKKLVAITGTNGKTSTAFFSYQLLKACNVPVAYIGTIGLKSFPFLSQYLDPLPALTTPDIFSLYRTLSICKEAGIDHVFLEASSHGLKQGRLDGLFFSAGCFTNLSPEHLDFHKTEEAYFQAKKLLFTKHMKPDATAVINIDDSLGKDIIKTCNFHNLKIKTFGENIESTLAIKSCIFSAENLHFTLIYDSVHYPIKLPFLGNFQAWNLAGALLLVISVSSIYLNDLIKKAPSINPPKGRMDLVGRTPSGTSIFIDFAHTPDALEKAFISLREYTDNKLWVVFGCGGDRDAKKRPLMGAVAERLADIVVITDDNPRSENPSSIRESIARACKESIILEDRTKAIEYTLNRAKKGDSILIAGKGDEHGQIIGKQKLPYSDYAVVKNWMKLQKNA